MDDRKKVMFVDDDNYVLAGLRNMLHDQEDEWDLYYIQGADDALKKIEDLDLDAIISDIRMPGKDGFEFLKILRDSDNTKDIPVIMLTGVGESDVKRRALNLGATDLLSKPVEREDLIARINSVLSLKSYQDEIKNQNIILEQKVKERTYELEESRLDIILRLAKAGEYRDEETGDHVARVGHYCRVIAEVMGLKRDFVETIFLTSPLHDIGKIGISDTILLKPGRLTPEERKIIEEHCKIGYEILSSKPKESFPILSWTNVDSVLEQIKVENPLLKMASTIAFYHHEKWDGNGYPEGLSGEDIPVEARIVAIADTYDALCSVRPYKPAFPDEKVYEILESEASHHFDPTVFSVFVKVKEELKSIREHYTD